MSLSRRSLRLFISVCVLFTIASATLAGVFKTGLLALASAETTQAIASDPAMHRFAPGTCETAGAVEVEGSIAGTTPTPYTTLKLAFDAINAGTHTGAIS